MATKAINHMINEFKEELMILIQDGINKGIPITVISMIVRDIGVETYQISENIIKQEMEQYSNELEKESHKGNNQER